MGDSRVQFPDGAQWIIRTLLEGQATREGTSVAPIPTGRRDDVSVLHVDGADVGLAGTDPFRRDGIAVDAVGGAPAALDVLQDRQFDCVVSEYDLGNTDGLALFEAVRDRSDAPPFVLFTDAGSEAVASEALSAGVDEYLRKGPPNRFERLASSVGRLVTDAQSPEPVGPSRRLREFFQFAVESANLYVWDWNLDTGTVRRYPSAETLFGLDDDALEPVFDGFLQRVAADHRQRVEATVTDALETGGTYELEYKLAAGDGSPVWIAERGSVLTDEAGQPTRAFGVNLDVTDRKERKRELEWERNLNWTLHEALVESRTRAELESAVVEQLQAYGYDLVWLGDSLVDELKPRAVAGTDAYLDELSPGPGQTRPGTEPSVRAATTGEAQFVEGFETGADETWQRAAVESGLRTQAALPLMYGDVLHGVLSVYDGDPGAFDETSRELLSELADALAFVIHNIETEQGLAADRTITATLQLVGTDYLLHELLRRADCEDGEARLVVRGTVPQSDGTTLQYLTVDGTSVETIRDAAAGLPPVESATVIDGEGSARLQVVHGQPTPERTLATVGARVRSTSVTARRADVLIDVPNKSALKTAIETLEANYEFVSILSSIERDAETGMDQTGPLTNLTDRQAAVLQAAYHQGYFEQPRERSATDIAESLDVSHPTFLEHLRLAQAQVFREHFE